MWWNNPRSIQSQLLWLTYHKGDGHARASTVVLAILLLALALACGAGPKATAGFTTITPATLGQTIRSARPTGPVVLSLTGKIGATEQHGPAQL